MPKPPPPPLDLSPDPYSPALDNLPSPDPSQSRFSAGPSSFLRPSAYPRAKIYSGTPLLAPPVASGSPGLGSGNASGSGSGHRNSFASSARSSFSDVDGNGTGAAGGEAGPSSRPYLAPPGLGQRVAHSGYTQPGYASYSGHSVNSGYTSYTGSGYSDTSSPALSPGPSSGFPTRRASASASGPSPSPSISSRHSNCELCALVAECKAAHDQAANTSRAKGQEREVVWTRRNIRLREVVWYDSLVTVYLARGKERLVGEGRHLIVTINTHAENVYQLGPIDVPLLSHMIDISHRLLNVEANAGDNVEVNVGFVGSVMRDPAFAHTHLHAHAYIGPIDPTAPGSTFWRRNVVFAPVNWWSLEDLRAEIREETSNNRVKSGYTNRPVPPIDQVPNAGSMAGPANALEPDTRPVAA